jgi:hypothetical protein
MRTKSLILVLSINAFILALALLVLEAIFGSWISPNFISRLNVPRGLKTTFEVTDLYNWQRSHVTYSRDEYGLRGTFPDPSDIDMLTVGGSTTDQRYIDDEVTWQNVMQDEFHRNGKSVFVANAGVDGQSTYGHIKNLDWWFPNIPNLKPKFILYYVGLNDFYKEGNYSFDALVNSENSLKQYLRERSAIYYLFRTLKGIYLARYVNKVAHGAIDLKSEALTESPLLQDYENLMNRRLEAYASRLRILINKTKSFNAIPVLITQPSRLYKIVNGTVVGLSKVSRYDGEEYNGVDFYYMMSLLNVVTMKTCARYGGICIDLGNEIVTKLEDEDFYDAAHMTPSGTEKVGLYLYSTLADYL